MNPSSDAPPAPEAHQRRRRWDLSRTSGTGSGDTRWTVAGIVPVIALVLLAGLALRLVLAFVIFPQAGLWSDIKLFADWSLTLTDHGPSGFYTEVFWSDYTPGYLWVLWAYGTVMKVIAGLTGGAAPELIPIWLKVPAILGDLLVAWIFYRAIRRWHNERWGVIVAAVYLFVPVTWYDSALWGQVDTMGVLVGGLALIWLIDRRPELAAGAAVAAVLVKPQFGIFLPIVGLVLLRQYLHRPRRPDVVDAPEGAGWRARLRAWWVQQDRDGPIRLLTSALVAFLVLVAMTVPFDLETRAPEGWAGIPIIGDLRGLLALISTTAGSYNYLTANAFNPWALVGPTPLTQAIGGDYVWTYDSLDILGMTAAFWGTALFVAVAVAVAVLLWRRQDRDAILIAATTLAVAFFVLPTKVHERYLFAAVGIGVLLLPRSRGWWAWFAAASGVLLVNMHAVLSLPFRGYGTEEMRALPLADLARTPLVVTLAALTCIPVLLWPIYEGWRLWRAGPSAGLATHARARPATAAPPRVRHPVQALPATAPVVAPSVARVRRGPAKRLLRGHVGRRGFVAVLLFMVGMTGLRLFQLDRPLGWYFDEDLHGRTATEFLQDWRYGIPHDILEWTHPHLAKYLQAASIEAIGGNEVSRTLDLGVDVVDAAVEPLGGNGSTTAPTPSRLIVATPEQLIVRELTGDEFTIAFPIDGISHVSVQPDDRLLWVSTTGGTLLRVELAQLDADAPESETPFISNVSELGAPIDGLWALPSGGVAILSEDILTLWGPEGRMADIPAAGLTDVMLVGAPDVPRLALLLPDGVHVVSFPDLAPVSSVPLDRRPLGAALADGDDYRNRSRDLLPDPRLYVATRGGVASIGGMAGDSLFVESDIRMPGTVRDVAWDPSSNMIHVLGEQDGRPTIYVIEPHGNAVFADAELPADPVAWALDTRTSVPANDRQMAVTVAADGSVAEVGLGGNAFASRFPGAVLGGIGAGLIVLLLMWLVASRAVAVIGGVLVAAETMLLTESRIATPDTMTICFVVAGWALLAWMLSRRDLHRRRWAWLLGFPAIGLLLGLAASTKWTGFYAFAGVLMVLLLLNPRLRMLAIGAALVVAIGLSLISLTGPTPNLQLVGVLAVAVALLVAWRRQWGSAPDGAEAILPVRVIAYGLVAIPVAGLIVYVLLFIPWTFLSLGDPQLFAGWPPGHTGETFLQLQQRMYTFHNDLTQPHGAGTPWWSWPVMLKPLWAYLEDFAAGSATILMPANPVVVWMSLPLIGWAVWRLMKGFSAPLLLLLVAFAVQWLPWVRVERVAFFYHYATAVPFILALLALFLARIRRGVSPRAWLAIRAGTVAILFYPAITWLMTGPLCSTLNITPDAEVCAGGWSETVGLAVVVGVVAVVVAIIAVGMRLADRWIGLDPRQSEPRARMFAEGLVGVVVVIAVALGALALGRAGVLEDYAVTIGSPLMMAAICALVALPLAILTVGARSPQKLVAGVLLAAITMALLLWPVLSGTMVLPPTMPYLAQSLLPTWETAFQFASGPGGIVPGALILGIPLLLVGGGAWFGIRKLDRRRGGSLPPMDG